MIPKGTKSEYIYEITWDEFCAAAVLETSYKDCGKPCYEICSSFMEVLSADNVKAYFRSRKFQNGELPVETAMCDHFKGWGNYSNNALGVSFNVWMKAMQTLSFAI